MTEIMPEMQDFIKEHVSEKKQSPSNSKKKNNVQKSKPKQKHELNESEVTHVKIDFKNTVMFDALNKAMSSKK